MHTIEIRCEPEPRVSTYLGEPGLLSRAGKILRERGLGETSFIITNPLVGRLYGKKLRDSLENSDLCCHYAEVPDGERYKTLHWIRRLYDRMGETKLDRGSTVIALGGGVICDMAGFAAATYMRGIPHISIPTTLLAQVDASIGGKVGVDYTFGKNFIGSFHQPRLILCDPEVLHTLKRRHFNCGMAEIVKSGIISSEEFFSSLESISSFHPALQNLESIIYETAAIKATYVAKDPFEKNVRAQLNFGHTIGHAIEAASHYKKYLHGEAISIGMTGALMISRECGLITTQLIERVERALKRCGLPVRCRGIEPGAIYEAMQMDKKKRKTIRFILIRKPGEAIIADDVPPDVIRRVLSRICG